MMQQLQAAMTANASSAIVAPLTYSIPADFFNASMVGLNMTAGANTTNSTAFGFRHLLAAGTVVAQSGIELLNGPRCKL